MLLIYFDGSASGRNKIGFAFVAYEVDESVVDVRDLRNYNGWQKIHEEWGNLSEKDIVLDGLPRLTNNMAEFEALKLAMCWLVMNYWYIYGKKILIRGDSQLVIYQMARDWKVKSGTSRHYVPKLIDMASNFGDMIEFEWVKRNNNKEADRLASAALIHKGKPMLEGCTVCMVDI